MAIEKDMEKILDAVQTVNEAQDDSPVQRIVKLAELQAQVRIRELKAIRRVNAAARYTFEDFIKEQRKQKVSYRILKIMKEFVCAILRRGPEEPEQGPGRRPKNEG